VVEYVLDVSHGMAGRVGHERKLAAVEDEILSTVRGERDAAFALRFAGPRCTDGYADPQVDFTKDAGDRFESALGDVAPGGRSDFARSVRYAVSDLNDRLDAGTEAVSMVFIVGARDRCTKRPGDVVTGALRRLRGRSRDVDIAFKFVGVKVPKSMRKLLKHTRRRVAHEGIHA
jgi:hypothetical protein